MPHSKKKSKKRRKRERAENTDDSLVPGKKAEKINEADYYSKNSEFRIWLNNRKGIHFSDCKEPRKYFEKFVKAWNRGKLEDWLYDGQIPSRVKVASLSKYNWNFEKNLNDQEQQDISSLSNKVDEATDSFKGS